MAMKSNAAKTQSPAPSVEAPAIGGGPAKRTGRTVVVACKIPNGLILQLQRKIQHTQKTMQGPYTEEIFVKVGDEHAVRGPAAPVGQFPRGYRPPEVVGGYALTRNIPADFWEQWIEQNKDAPYVHGGMIFAHNRRDDTAGQAFDQSELKSGFEPLTPDKDSRIPKSPLAAVSSVETADQFHGNYQDTAEVETSDQ